MSFQAKALADGTLPTSQGAIYTVPIGMAASYVKQVLLFNSNAATQTITLWLVPNSGTARLWRRLVLETNESAELLEHGESLQLESANSIQAVTTTASAVDYTITGVEEN